MRRGISFDHVPGAAPPVTARLEVQRAVGDAMASDASVMVSHTQSLLGAPRTEMYVVALGPREERSVDVYDLDLASTSINCDLPCVDIYATADPGRLAVRNRSTTDVQTRLTIRSRQP